MTSEKRNSNSPYNVIVLHEGYSESVSGGSKANCSCTLVKGYKNIIVDTMTSWDGDIILRSLNDHNVKPSDIDYVISTHGHSDHCGNNNLFLNATHIVGFTISHKNHFYSHNFEGGVNYKIDDYVEVIPTPGHMLAHVSVLVRTADSKTVVVAGDLFENERDISDDNIWLEAGSENQVLQTQSREMILKLADYIIPGHGKMFNVARK